MDWDCESGEIALITDDGCQTQTTGMEVSFTPIKILGDTLLPEDAPDIVYTVLESSETYTWSVPTNATISSGQGTDSITVDWGSTSGDVIVELDIGCGLETGALEVQIFDPETFNWALGQPVVASSVERFGFEAANAVDGDEETRWSSEFSDPQWIYVDLGSSILINKVILTWHAFAAEDYEIQVSEDTIEWQTVFLERFGNGGTDIIALNTQGRYLRIFGNITLDQGYSLWEIEVFSPPVVTGIEEGLNTAQVDFQIYPNPATDHIIVTIANHDRPRKKAELHLYNLYGQEMLNRTLTPVELAKGATINLTQFIRGLYTVMILADHKTYYHKLLVD